jgi:ribulose-phosphate 3-epimerase
MDIFPAMRYNGCRRDVEVAHVIQIAPSILSADFARLGEQVREAEAAGADRIHFDVMDGHFVPNITVGPLVLRGLRPVTALPLCAHLMIAEADRFLEDFARAGADLLIVHVEACPHLHRTVQAIRSLGVSPGVTLNPATPLHALDEILPCVDAVLVMTVNPGWGGQTFIPEMVDKVARLRRAVAERGLSADILVDGGINVETAPLVVRAGANVLVAGDAIFGAPEGVTEALAQLRASANTTL